MMKKFLFIICSLFLFSTISSVSWALPPCVANAEFWDNCFGTWRHEEGYKYVGEWKDNKQNGQGTANWSNGDKYVGNYKGGKKNGQGTYIYADGEKYFGEYKDDLRHGQGTNTWADGRKEVGQYKDGKLNGYAIQYNADGSIFKEGIFKDGIFQYAQKKPSANSNSKLNKYKEFCEEIGFKLGTEKFADCVLKAMEKD